MSETTSSINPIHTSCKECVFAVYNGNTQNSCAMNMIDIYKAKQAQIIEAYDDEKEFYIINDKKCISYRKEIWFKEFEDYTDSIDYKIKKTIESNSLNYIIVIDLKNFTIDQLEQTIKHINDLTIKPKRIILLRYSYLNKIFDFDIIKKYLDMLYGKIPWRVQTILDEIEIRSILSSTIILYKQHRFMLYIDGYSDKINKIVDKGNQIAFKELETFEIITDPDKQAKLFSVIVYRYLWSMEGKDILNLNNNQNEIIV